jgi:hypothetical protein
MLLDQAKGLAARIGDYSRLKSNAGAARDFETRARMFGDAAQALDAAKTSLDRLKAAAIDPDFVAIDAVGLATKATTLRDLLKEDPSKLNDPPFNLKYEFVDRVGSLSNTANKAVLAAWQAHIAKNSVMASPEMLSALAAIPQYKPVVLRIGALKAQVAMLAQSVPDDIAGGLAQLKTIMESYAAAWGEMIGNGIPKNVIAFLRAAAAQGAVLDQLTDEVRTWLEARGLLSLFRIKI